MNHCPSFNKLWEEGEHLNNNPLKKEMDIMVRGLEILPKWEKWPEEEEIDVFNRDFSRMGTRIGSGPIMAMYTNHSNYKDIILVNTKTGARCKITLA